MTSNSDILDAASRSLVRMELAGPGHVPPAAVDPQAERIRPAVAVSFRGRGPASVLGIVAVVVSSSRLLGRSMFVRAEQQAGSTSSGPPQSAVNQYPNEKLVFWDEFEVRTRRT